MPEVNADLRAVQYCTVYSTPYNVCSDIQLFPESMYEYVLEGRQNVRGRMMRKILSDSFCIDSVLKALLPTRSLHSYFTSKRGNTSDPSPVARTFYSTRGNIMLSCFPVHRSTK